jgi:hypothetical protein
VKSSLKVRSSPAGTAAAAIAAGASRTPPRATLDPARWGPGAEKTATKGGGQARRGGALSERGGVEKVRRRGGDGTDSRP